MEAPHIGQLLKAHIKEHRYYQSALARDLGVYPETVADFLKRPDNRLTVIWKICLALRYNFLSDLAAQLPPDLPCAPTAKDRRIAELEAQVEALQAECRTLERIVEALKGR
jgi:hypothetical protein